MGTNNKVLQLPATLRHFLDIETGIEKWRHRTTVERGSEDVCGHGLVVEWVGFDAGVTLVNHTTKAHFDRR